MPFKSKAQQRLFFAKENRGELPKGKAKEWADETPDIKSLPEKKHTKKANISPELEAQIQASPELMKRRRGVYDAYQKGLSAQKPKSKWFNPSAFFEPMDVMEEFTNLVTGNRNKSAASDDPMLIRKEIRESAEELHDTASPLKKSKLKKLKTLKSKLYAGSKSKKATIKKTASQIAYTVLQKTASISSADIARAIAGMKADREITPEEVESFRQEVGRSSGRSGGIGGAIMGGLGGALSGGMLARGNPLLGALGGGAAGAGLLGGLGYLLGRSSGRDWGGHLAEVAQAGELPSPLPYSAERYTPHAIGKWEDQAAPLSPEEYDAMRKQMMQEAMIQGGLEGVASGGLSSIARSNYEDGESSLSSVMRPLAQGAGEAAFARQEAIAQAQQIQDLYRRGYVDLANRLREESGY